MFTLLNVLRLFDNLTFKKKLSIFYNWPPTKKKCYTVKLLWPLWKWRLILFLNVTHLPRCACTPNRSEQLRLRTCWQVNVDSLALMWRRAGRQGEGLRTLAWAGASRPVVAAGAQQTHDCFRVKYSVILTYLTCNYKKPAKCVSDYA